MAAIDLGARTLAAALWAPAQVSPLLRGAMLALAGSLFVALCAQITVPLWPVPVTGQTFAVLSVGLICGWRVGGAALLLYLIEGALGLPFFAGGAGGWASVVGPSGGYIWGFVLAAALVGYLAERGWDRNVLRTAAALFLGNVVLYVPGLIWLALFYAGPGQDYIAATGASTAWGASINAGLLPFLLGDALKLALAATLIPAIWSLLRRRHG
jgi:biotin transport system substrate-specific component